MVVAVLLQVAHAVEDPALDGGRGICPPLLRVHGPLEAGDWHWCSRPRTRSARVCRRQDVGHGTSWWRRRCASASREGWRRRSWRGRRRGGPDTLSAAPLPSATLRVSRMDRLWGACPSCWRWRGAAAGGGVVVDGLVFADHCSRPRRADPGRPRATHPRGSGPPGAPACSRSAPPRSARRPVQRASFSVRRRARRWTGPLRCGPGTSRGRRGRPAARTPAVPGHQTGSPRAPCSTR